MDNDPRREAYEAGYRHGIERLQAQHRREVGVEEWSCGHVAGSMCQECWRLLAVRAAELVAENDELRERIAKLERKPDDKPTGVLLADGPIRKEPL